jgi:hypothetical protein
MSDWTWRRAEGLGDRGDQCMNVGGWLASIERDPEIRGAFYITVSGPGERDYHEDYTEGDARYARSRAERLLEQVL